MTIIIDLVIISILYVAYYTGLSPEEDNSHGISYVYQQMEREEEINEIIDDFTFVESDKPDLLVNGFILLD